MSGASIAMAVGVVLVAFLVWSILALMLNLPWFLIPSEWTRAFGLKVVPLGEFIGHYVGVGIEWIWHVLKSAWNRLFPAVQETFTGLWEGISALVLFWVAIGKTAYRYLTALHPQYQVLLAFTVVGLACLIPIVYYFERIVRFLAKFRLYQKCCPPPEGESEEEEDEKVVVAPTRSQNSRGMKHRVAIS